MNFICQKTDDKVFVRPLRQSLTNVVIKRSFETSESVASGLRTSRCSQVSRMTTSGSLPDSRMGTSGPSFHHDDANDYQIQKDMTEIGGLMKKYERDFEKLIKLNSGRLQKALIPNYDINRCICDKQGKSVLCLACGHWKKGIIRVLCRVHPMKHFLSSWTTCPNCHYEAYLLGVNKVYTTHQ